MEKFIENLIDTATSSGLKLLYALLVLIIGLWLVKKMTTSIGKKKSILKVDPGVQTFLSSFLRIGLSALVIIIAAGIIGIPMTSFITVLASAGVAIGLALQGALSNFAGGLMILIFHPFHVGDYIETDKYEGIVKDINVFYTVLVTYDKKHVTLPNGSLTNAAIINHFTEPCRRVDFTFSAAYSNHVDKVKEVLLTTATAQPFVLSEPSPDAFCSGHGDSAVTFTLRVWCKTEHYWDVKNGMYAAVKKAFDENDVQIPFPQMDVHMVP